MSAICNTLSLWISTLDSYVRKKKPHNNFVVHDNIHLFFLAFILFID